MFFFRSTTEIEKTKIIRKEALYFIFRAKVLVASHSRIVGPNQLLFKSIWWNLGELWANSAEAISKNGVVGSSGSTMPIIPRRTKNQPRRTNRYFLKKPFKPGNIGMLLEKEVHTANSLTQYFEQIKLFLQLPPPQPLSSRHPSHITSCCQSWIDVHSTFFLITNNLLWIHKNLLLITSNLLLRTNNPLLVINNLLLITTNLLFEINSLLLLTANSLLWVNNLLFVTSNPCLLQSHRCKTHWNKKKRENARSL